MDGIEVIETEWGSELHLGLIALEQKARVEWRDSPAAREEMKRLAAAAKAEKAPMEVAPIPEESLKLQVHIWD
jgi:hypothetical protein